MFKPELLAPAGDLEKLKTAYRYGADACYMGVKAMSMRMKINDADGDVLEEALQLKNELGKKLYITMNIHAHESRLNFLDKELDRLTELHEEGLDPDGILVSDVGILTTIQEKCPWIPIHISTQANILNSAGIAFWAKQGAERVVLGREASLREIKIIRKELKAKGIEVELEAFVHGAMCMAYSGRCLLSSFMSSRDANEGMCSHSCRWNYKVHEKGCSKNTDSSEYKTPKGEYTLEEKERPGEHFPIEEDENGTSIMSSKDMCMVEHMDDVLSARVDSLKIEGRHKTIYYLAIATRAYRMALDATIEGKPLDPEVMELISSIDTRGYFTGFWYGKPGAEGQKYKDNRSGDYNDSYCFAGVIRSVENGQMVVEVKNRLEPGDRLDVIAPDKTIPITLGAFKNAATDEMIEVASSGQGFSIKMNAPDGVEAGFVLRKHMTQKDVDMRKPKVKIQTQQIKKHA